MGALRNLILADDSNRRPVLGSVQAGGYCDCRVLAAATAETQAVPSGARKVLIAATGPAFVAFGGAATVPAADITGGSSPVLVGTSPRMFSISNVTSIGVIASAIQTVTFEFFS